MKAALMLLALLLARQLVHEQVTAHWYIDPRRMKNVSLGTRCI